MAGWLDVRRETEQNEEECKLKKEKKNYFREVTSGWSFLNRKCVCIIWFCVGNFRPNRQVHFKKKTHKKDVLYFNAWWSTTIQTNANTYWEWINIMWSRAETMLSILYFYCYTLFIFVSNLFILFFLDPYLAVIYKTQFACTWIFNCFFRCNNGFRNTFVDVGAGITRCLYGTRHTHAFACTLFLLIFLFCFAIAAKRFFFIILIEGYFIMSICVWRMDASSWGRLTKRNSISGK